MGRTYYMHTLNGKAAHFDGNQIYRTINGHAVAASLKQIRREQNRDQEYRARMGFTFDRGALGYVRFRLPESES